MSLSNLRDSNPMSQTILEHLSPEDFSKDVQGFFYKRLERSSYSCISPEYNRLSNKVNEQFKYLQAVLAGNTEAQKVLMENSDNQNEVLAEIETLAYRHGFSDGVRFLMKTLTA